MELEKFGKFIQEQRTLKGYTQEQIGSLLGVTDKAVSRWERGECYPEITQLPRIAELFGITADELINSEYKPKKLLPMCANCKNAECKKTNYSKLIYCANSFHWAIFGISVSVLFIVTLIGYLVVRIADGNWGDWRLPAVLALVFIGVVSTGAMLFSLKDVKREMKPGDADAKNDKFTDGKS